MDPKPKLMTIGWREMVSLPAWGIPRIRAKIDTGARTSAIHVSAIEELPGGRVRFQAVVRDRAPVRGRWVEAEVVRRGVVKPSTGDRQERIVCSTLLRLGGVEREVEVGLVCRRGMLCRMLIGRRAIAGAFLVDPGARYLVTAPTSRSGGGPA